MNAPRRLASLDALRGCTAAAMLLGGLWSLWLPFNKNLWTSSFALWTAGWAALALPAFTC